MVRKIKSVSSDRAWFEPRQPGIRVSSIPRSPPSTDQLSPQFPVPDIYANSQVERRSLVFTPNVPHFSGSARPCFTISPAKPVAPCGMPYDLCHPLFHSHCDSPELMNLKSLNACGKRSISFPIAFFFEVASVLELQRIHLKHSAAARAWYTQTLGNNA